MPIHGREGVDDRHPGAVAVVQGVPIDSGVPSSATAPAQLALDRAIAAETGRGRDDEHQLWHVALTRARYAALIGRRPNQRGIAPLEPEDRLPGVADPDQGGGPSPPGLGPFGVVRAWTNEAHAGSVPQVRSERPAEPRTAQWLRGAVRDCPDRVLRASNEAEQPRTVARTDLHGALETVERRDRVVDGRR